MLKLKLFFANVLFISNLWLLLLLIYYFMILEKWKNNFDDKTTNLLSILYNISIINKEWKINKIDKLKWRILIAKFNLFWNDQIILLALLFTFFSDNASR